MTHLAFVDGVVHRGRGTPDADRLYVADGRVAPWPPSLPDGTTLIDLDGGYLGPAFGDGHVHPLLAGREADGPALRDATTVEDLVGRVAAWASEHPEAEWITGGSYDATITVDGLFDARWLDAAVPDRPVVLRAWDYHTVWCNTAALEQAGITGRTEDPVGGRIVRRPDGSPQGTLLEAAAGLVLSRVPRRPLHSDVRALDRATRTLAAQGITFAQEAWAEPEDVDAWAAAARAGLLHVEVDLALRADPLKWPGQLPLFQGIRERLEPIAGLSARTVKFFVDGIIENHTAHLLDEYADACTHGLPNWDADTLVDAVGQAYEAGFDVHFHAIGDSGVRSVLTALEKAGPSERRATLAHAQLISEQDLPRLADLGLTICFQPLWAAPDPVMTGLTLPRLGPRRSLQYRMRSALRHGARISFGSDWPVTSPDVLAGIRTAVTRQTADGVPDGGWHPAERLTVEEALDAATSGVARQTRGEDIRGHLATGARADLVWLSHDPRTVTPASLDAVVVKGTWLKGRLTHSCT